MSTDTLTITQAAEALDLSRQQVHNLIKAGTLAAEHRPGWPWSIDAASVARYGETARKAGRKNAMTDPLRTALIGHLIDLLDSEDADFYTWDQIKVYNAGGWTLETSGKSGTQEWVNRHEGVSFPVPALKDAYGEALRIVDGTAPAD